MSVKAVIRAASAGLIHRRVQTLVVLVVLTASAANGVLGLTLLTSGNEGFDKPFAIWRGPDLAVYINSRRVTATELAVTRRLAEVTKAAGPYPATSVSLTPNAAASAHNARNGQGNGQSGLGASGASSVVGRASRGGPLDDVTLNAGRWPTRPGEIALGVYTGFLPPLGSKVIADAPGHPRLTVVGYAGSIARDEDAWVLPSEVAAVRPAGSAPEEEMLYTFRSAGTPTQMNRDLEGLEAALPKGAIISSVSWLLSKEQTSSESSINTPFVVAFGLIALLLSVLIVASVVSSAVVAGYRRIGILKSIGFTPGQVTVSYVAQIGVPTVVGCVIGTIVGSRWVSPLLEGVPGGGVAHTVPTWIEVVVPVGLCALVALASSIPALRAGSLSAVTAIARGVAPARGHGYGVHRLFGKLRAPRPVTLGLADPFTRPTRSALTVVAIASGVAAVILAVGLNSSLTKVSQISARELDQGQVQLTPTPPQTSFTSKQQRAIEAALHIQPGTSRYVATGSLHPSFDGTSQTINVSDLQFPLVVTAYQGESRWLGWDLISGRWYSKPGEIDVNTSFLIQTGRSVGETVPLNINGRTTTVRIVGQVFISQIPQLFTSWGTLTGTSAGLTISQYDIQLRANVNPQTYVQALGKTLGPSYSVSLASVGSNFGRTDTSLMRDLTVIIAILAGLGVLNAVLIVTRERVHDLGIFKAIGMTPRQTIAMVICWVVAPAIIAAVIAIPAGILLHTIALNAIGRTQFTGIPSDVIHIYAAPQLVLLALAGFAIAAAGALLPATWAAASKTAAAIQAE